MSTSYGITKEAIIESGVVPVLMAKSERGVTWVSHIWNGVGWLSRDGYAGFAWMKQCQEEGLGFTTYPAPPHMLQAPMVGLIEAMMPQGWS